MSVTLECAGALVRHPARIWNGKKNENRGSWQDIDEAISPEESVRIQYAGGECCLLAWSGNPDHPDYQHDMEDLCIGHVLLDKGYDGLEGRPEKRTEGEEEVGTGAVRRCGTAYINKDAAGNRVVTVRLLGQTDTDSPVVSGGDPGTLAPEAVLKHMETFLTLPGTCPGLWESTGCFHRAAMLDARTGVFVRLVEDIGRHNCLDRLAGWACRNGLFPGDFVLFLSARITGSLYAKARRAGFRFLVSRAAVTTAALGTEGEGCSQHRMPVSIVGFCRPREARLTVFCDPEGRVRSC